LQPNDRNLRWPSAVYAALLAAQRLETRSLTRPLWRWAWDQFHRRYRGQLRVTLHQQPALLPVGYTYPLYIRRFPHLNEPLVELVHQAYQTAGRAVGVVDVGAAVGDTILLLQANCPGMIGSFLCVDGDEEFFEYLRANLSRFPNGKLIRTMLSASSEPVAAPVRIHGGTASAQGAGRVASRTLDDVIVEASIGSVDVVKVDVDGFDGQVLSGAAASLQRWKPAVVFEWHPGLCARTGNSWFGSFDALQACGYDRFAWFDKYGVFSHFTEQVERSVIERMARFCVETQTRPDWHYDVVALHRSSQIPIISLADCGFARRRSVPH
jgi:FkbM family methyltransferase